MEIGNVTSHMVEEEDVGEVAAVVEGEDTMVLQMSMMHHKMEVTVTMLLMSTVVVTMLLLRAVVVTMLLRRVVVTIIKTLLFFFLTRICVNETMSFELVLMQGVDAEGEVVEEEKEEEVVVVDSTTDQMVHRFRQLLESEVSITQT